MNLNKNIQNVATTDKVMEWWDHKKKIAYTFKVKQNLIIV